MALSSPIGKAKTCASPFPSALRIRKGQEEASVGGGSTESGELILQSPRQSAILTRRFGHNFLSFRGAGVRAGAG